MRLYVPTLVLLIVGFALFAPAHLALYMATHQHEGMGHEGHSQHASNQMDMAMPMFFQASFHTVLWFKSLETHSFWSYVAAILGLVVFGVAHESVALLRKQIALRQKPSRMEALLPQPDHFRCVESRPVRPLRTSFSPRAYGCSSHDNLWQRAVNSSLYAVHLSTGYLLMLAVMSFNVGFFVAVVVGMGLGHFLFHPSMSTPAFDTCHESATFD